jgi:hypothetical protein
MRTILWKFFNKVFTSEIEDLILKNKQNSKDNKGTSGTTVVQGKSNLNNLIKIEEAKLILSNEKEELESLIKNLNTPIQKKYNIKPDPDCLNCNGSGIMMIYGGPSRPCSCADIPC